MKPRKLLPLALCLLISCLNRHTGLGALPQNPDADSEAYNEQLARTRAMAASLQSQDQNDLARYERFATAVQSEWKRRNPEYYGRLMLEICRPLSSGRFKTDRQYDLARRYALSALERADAIPLTLELELTGYASTLAIPRTAIPDEKFVQQRKKDVETRLHAWRRLLGAIDPNWDPSDVPRLNIVPPPGTGLPSGVAPEAIKDVTLRAEYEAAIQRNKQKAERYRTQYGLRNWLKRYAKRTEDYLISIYSEPPYDIEELGSLLKQYIREEQTRTKILNAIKKKMNASPNSGGGSENSLLESATN